jgi:hypothetical protein
MKNPKPIRMFASALWTRARVAGRLAGCLAIGAALAGCASGFTKVAPAQPTEYKSLGNASGSACGMLGVMGTAYYFVPMGLNGRIERAYQNALESVPGATALVGVTMSEDWYWVLLGTVRCVNISGEAIQ